MALAREGENVFKTVETLILIELFEVIMDIGINCSLCKAHLNMMWKRLFCSFKLHRVHSSLVSIL